MLVGSTITANPALQDVLSAALIVSRALVIVLNGLSCVPGLLSFPESPENIVSTIVIYYYYKHALYYM